MQSQYKVGDILIGEVHHEFEWGCLLQLPDGVTGRLPFNELSWTKASKPLNDIYSPGTRLCVKVMEAKPNKNRGGQYLTFSLRRLLPNPWSQVEEFYPIGTRIIAPVSRFIKHGAVVDLPAGLSILIHHSEVSWTDARAVADSVLAVGQVIPMVVTLSTATPRKLQASYKRAIPDPWPNLAASCRSGQEFLGKVSSLKDYGIFVKLPNGLVGLIHSSVLPAEPEFLVGDNIEVKVLTIDAESRRISLGNL